LVFFWPYLPFFFFPQPLVAPFFHACFRSFEQIFTLVNGVGPIPCLEALLLVPLFSFLLRLCRPALLLFVLRRLFFPSSLLRLTFSECTQKLELVRTPDSFFLHTADLFRSNPSPPPSSLACLPYASPPIIARVRAVLLSG